MLKTQVQKRMHALRAHGRATRAPVLKALVLLKL